MIKLNDLRKYYNAGKSNQVKAVDGITLELPDSGLVVLFGKSGCGKTTLLNAVGGLDKTTGGTIEIDGKILSGYNSKEWDAIRNEHIGYIFQNYNLVADVTVYRNIEMALEIAGMSDRRQMRERITYALSLVGMEKFKNRLPTALSGGQQQRVGIARAIAKAPSVIIADEPTGNLDDKNTLAIMEILKQISKHCLVLLVTHEEKIARFYADRVIQIVDGHVVADVTPKEGENRTLAHRTGNKIFLGDMTLTEAVVGENIVKLYTDKPLSGVNVQLAYHNGQLYVRANADCRVQYIEEGSETLLLDEKYSDKTLDEDAGKATLFDRSILSTIPYSKHNLFDSRKIAVNMWRRRQGLTKKKRAPFTMLMLMALLITAITPFVANNLLFKEEFDRTRDEKIIRVEMQTGKTAADYAYLEGTNGVTRILPYDINMLSIVLGEISTSSYLNGAYFAESTIDIQNGAQVLPISLMSGDMYAGRAATADDEIVVDKLLLSRVESGGGMLRSGLIDYADFVGEKIMVYSTMQSYRIVGIVDSDSPHVYVTDTVFAAVSGGAVRSIRGGVSYDCIDVFCADKDAALSYFRGQNMEVYDYAKQEKSEFLKTAISDSSGMLILMLIAFIIIAFSSKKLAHGTFILRIKELGILRAIGATKANIVKLFSVEGTVLALLYSVAGWLFGSVILWWLLSKNINLRALLYYPLWVGLIIGAFLFVTSVFTYVLPALKLIRKTPSEILTKYDV